jgi:ABC-2 type transport system permease protein
MEASLDLSRWRETPQGVGYRRWTIVSAGLSQLFRMRFFKILLAVAWSAGLVLAVLGFLFAQSIATGGWLESGAALAGPRAQAIVAVLAGLVTLYPDICIGGWYTLIFYAHSFAGLWLSLLALTVMVPRLITRDRATNALTVYLSRPLTSGDYLLGKLGMIVGMLMAVWTGPLLFGWLLSVVFAPDRDFIIYSFTPLLRALLFNGIALTALAAIALGVSAIGKTARSTIPVWIGLWLVMGFISHEPHSPRWLQRASFTQDLSEIRQKIIPLDEALVTAGESLPIANQGFAQNLAKAGRFVESTDFTGAIVSLGFFVVLSSFVFTRKLRPE